MAFNRLIIVRFLKIFVSLSVLLFLKCCVDLGSDVLELVFREL
jgi:hypothetical protein